MKKLLIPLFACFILSSISIAQNNVASLSPEELEAQKLNAQVLELYKLSEYDKALQLGKKAIDILKKVSSVNPKLLSQSFSNLAFIYKAKALEYQTKWFKGIGSKAMGFIDKQQESISDSEKFFLKALEVEEKYFRGETKEAIIYVTELARLNAAPVDSADYSKAEKFYKRAIMLKEKVGSAENKEFASLLLEVSRFYFSKREDYKIAETHIQRGLALAEKLYETNQVELLLFLKTHASVLVMNDKSTQAIKYIKRIQEIESNAKISPEKSLLKEKPIYYPKINMVYLFPEGNFSRDTKVIVNEEGKVISAKFVGSHLRNYHQQHAEISAMRSRFLPKVVNGVAVQFTTVIQ